MDITSKSHKLYVNKRRYIDMATNIYRSSCTFDSDMTESDDIRVDEPFR